MSLVGSVVLLCATLLLPESSAGSALRVIGGRDAAPGEYPFVVRLEGQYKYTIGENTTTKIIPGCSGTALAPIWTLTAAHCVGDVLSSSRNESNIIIEFRHMIRYGKPHMKPSENNHFSAILKSKKPKMFPSESGDIALAFTEPISLERYAKVSAIDHRALFGHEVTIMGFGMMRVKPNFYDFDVTSRLDKPLQIMDKAMVRSCDDNEVLTYLCAVPACGDLQTAFYGDSGGPVFHASGIIGVVIGGTDGLFHKGRESLKHVAKLSINVIQPVSPYLNWIDSVITGHEE